MAKIKVNSGTYDVACPECSAETNFVLAVETTVAIWDELPAAREMGTQTQFIGFYADGDSQLTCRTCEHQAALKSFRRP